MENAWKEKEITVKKGVHKNLACNFIIKETLVDVFSCKFCQIFKKTFFTKHLWVTASGFTWQCNIHPASTYSHQT